MRRHDLVGLVDAAPGPLRSLRATERHWLHRERAERSVSPDDRVAWQPPEAVAPAAPRPGGDDAFEIRSQVFYAAPGRTCVVTATAFGPGDVVESVEILNGGRRWTGFGGRYIEQDLPAAFPRGTFGSLLLPGYVLGALVLDHPVDDVLQGRRCVRVDARRRPGGAAGPIGPADNESFVIADAGAHRFWFDAVYGVALRHEVLVDGLPATVTELLDLVVDAPLPDARFLPPAGAAVQSQSQFEAELRAMQAQEG